MKKKYFLVYIGIVLSLINVNAETLGTNNSSVNTEIRKLVSEVAPRASNFKWSCETVSKIQLANSTSVVDKCLVDTNIGINFKVTCEYAILVIGSATSCELGW